MSNAAYEQSICYAPGLTVQRTTLPFYWSDKLKDGTFPVLLVYPLMRDNFVAGCYTAVFSLN
jgi:hypothetical protein